MIQTSAGPACDASFPTRSLARLMAGVELVKCCWLMDITSDDCSYGARNSSCRPKPCSNPSRDLILIKIKKFIWFQ